MRKMKYPLFFLLLLLCFACSIDGDKSTNLPTNKPIVNINSPAPKKSDKFKVVHTFVALCDNEHQTIVKVPPKIGNGKDAENNLYWGCDLGIKTYFKKSKDWKLLQTIVSPKEKVIERCIFKHQKEAVLMVADAYDGEFIKPCTIDFLNSCAGLFNDFIVYQKDSIACGGNADLIAYIGHDGLMQFDIEGDFKGANSLKREAIILACRSKIFFTPYLQSAQAQPLIWTTDLMAPEAYTLKAALDEWVEKKDNNTIREAAAQAYHKYQNCGIRAARNLLVTGY